VVAALVSGVGRAVQPHARALENGEPAFVRAEPASANLSAPRVANRTASSVCSGWITCTIQRSAVEKHRMALGGVGQADEHQRRFH